MMFEDRGTVSIFVAISFTAILAVLGLLSDGTSIRNERRQLSDIVAQAARVAAQEIDIEELRATGEITIDKAKARNQASSIVGKRTGADSDIFIEVNVLKNEVSVSAQKTIELWGGREIDVRADHTAKATAQHINDEEFKDEPFP